MKKISYQQKFKNISYKVSFVTAVDDFFLSNYLARYIFLSQLKNNYYLKTFFNFNGRLSNNEKDIIETISDISIKEEMNINENMFKNEVLL